MDTEQILNEIKQKLGARVKDIRNEISALQDIMFNANDTRTKNLNRTIADAELEIGWIKEKLASNE